MKNSPKITKKSTTAGIADTYFVENAHQKELIYENLVIKPKFAFAINAFCQLNFKVPHLNFRSNSYSILIYFNYYPLYSLYLIFIIILGLCKIN